jgi:amino acid transporter
MQQACMQAFFLLCFHFFELESLIITVYFATMAWCLVHFVVIKGMDFVILYRNPNSRLVRLCRALKEGDNQEKVINFSRLVRSLLYCAFAGIAGLYLLFTQLVAQFAAVLHNHVKCV